MSSQDNDMSYAAVMDSKAILRAGIAFLIGTVFRARPKSLYKMHLLGAYQ